MIRSVKNGDAPGLAEIYNYYIEKSAATFETEPIPASEMERRIRDVPWPWLVWEEGGELLGYCYMHNYHTRSAYRFTLEDSVYIKHGFQGRGIGRALLGEVLSRIRGADIHAVISVITVPNPASVGLHEAFGFKPLGVFREVGWKLDAWRDVGYWELLLAACRA